MRGWTVAALLAILSAGCGPPAPTLAGGKPVSHWVQALHDPDARARKAAVEELGNVGTGDAAALPAVIDALNDPDAAVRREAILGLVKSGRAAARAIPTLSEMRQNDPDAQVREYAARALEKLQGDK